MSGKLAYDGALTVLELLAKEAPLEELDELVRLAHRADVSPEELDRLECARKFAVSIRSQLSRYQQREAGLSALVDTARDVTTPYDLDALLKVIARRARRLLSLDISCISFHEPSEGCSYVRTADGHISMFTLGSRIPPDSGAGVLASASSAPFWTSDYLPDERIQHSSVLDELIRTEGVRALMAIPLRHSAGTLGILYVGGRTIRHFTPEEVSLMSSLADLAVVAIEKARLLDRTHATVAELELDTSLAKSRLTAVQRLSATHSRLIEIVLTCRDLQALVTEAAEALGGGLAVRDAGGDQLAVAGDVPALDGYAFAEAALDAHTAHRPVSLDRGVWVAAVRAGTEDLGTLLLHPRDRFDEHGVQLLHLTAQVVALLLMMQRSTAAAEGLVRDELLDDLLTFPQRAPEKLRQRARRLALDLSEPHVVVAARPEGGALGRAIVWASSYAARTGGLKSIRDDCLILLLPGTNPGDAARAVREELAPLLGHPVTVGAAGPGTSPAKVPGLYSEALRCIDALSAMGGTGGSACAQELGFLGLLLSDNRDVDGFITSALGPVLDYDRQRFTELTRTLQAYFDSGGSPTYAAEALHVHPNTVSRRLERITELLGPDWQKPAQALEVQLALGLHRTRRTLDIRPGASGRQPPFPGR